MSMQHLFSKTATLATAILVCVAPVSYGLVIRVYNASRHKRFNGFPSTPVQNPTFMHASLDLTGVGWNTGNTNFQYTLVSPMHFVGANHIKPSVGATLRFVSSDGTIRNYVVASRTPIKNGNDDDSDLFIGRLYAAVPNSDGVRFYPYLNLRNEAAYTGEPVIFLGKPARGASQTISSFTNVSSSSTNPTRAFSMLYNTIAGGNDDAYLENGDSGSPVFIDENGIPAIVGVNSLVSNTTILVTNYANFIPHYIDELNAVMENHGYHMTKSRPGSTAVSVNHTPQSAILRAGHPFDIHITVANGGNREAENVKLSHTFPAGVTINSSSGTGWFGGGSAARRAAIAPNSSASPNILNITVATAGSHSHSLTFSSDQSSQSTQNFPFDVIESYVSYTSSLADKTTTSDDDQDGITNLLEYAFGGDVTTTSRFLADETTHLLPTISRVGGVTQLSFLRRKDAAQRAITYTLTSSTTLESASWLEASAMVSNTSTTSINAEIELVTLTLSPTGSERFFRIEVNLAE